MAIRGGRKSVLRVMEKKRDQLKLLNERIMFLEREIILLIHSTSYLLFSYFKNLHILRRKWEGATLCMYFNWMIDVQFQVQFNPSEKMPHQTCFFPRTISMKEKEEKKWISRGIFFFHFMEDFCVSVSQVLTHFSFMKLVQTFAKVALQKDLFFHRLLKVSCLSRSI